MVPGGVLEWSPAVAHHPVVAHPTLGLQSKDADQFRAARSGPVIVLRLCRVLDEAAIEREEIMRFHVGVGGGVFADPLAEAPVRTALLVPGVKAAVRLNQLAKMFLRGRRCRVLFTATSWKEAAV